MSGLVHLRTLVRGDRPADDGLLGNARCSWGGRELMSEEAIFAAFAARPSDPEGELFSAETRQSAALIVPGRAVVADLYEGRIGRLWRVGEDIARPAEPAIDVAFDADMRQARGELYFRAEDHPELDPATRERLLAAARDLIERRRNEGKLRVRGFFVRAFGGPQASAALLSLFTLGNEARRSAAFSYAVIGLGSEGDEARTILDPLPVRDWSPRF